MKPINRIIRSGQTNFRPFVCVCACRCRSLYFGQNWPNQLIQSIILLQSHFQHDDWQQNSFRYLVFEFVLGFSNQFLRTKFMWTSFGMLAAVDKSNFDSFAHNQFRDAKNQTFILQLNQNSPVSSTIWFFSLNRTCLQFAYIILH